MKTRSNIQTATALRKKEALSIIAIKRMLALIVLLMQCFLPVSQIFANELNLPETTTLSDPSPVIEEKIEIEDVVVTSEESTKLVSDSTLEEIESIDQSETQVSEEPITKSVPTSEFILVETTTEVSETVSEPSDESGISLEEPSTGTDSETSDIGEEIILETATTTSTSTTTATPITPTTTDSTQIEEEIIEESPEAEEIQTEEVENTETEQTSTSTEVTVVQPENHVSVNDTNRFSFSEQECARVSNGTFYCSKEDAPTTTMGIERVFSAPDIDGDEEIYIEHDGELTQISNNLTDDSAPYYDKDSESLVWHRLIEERYQIVSFDLTSREEKVLTSDRYNNMQPTRYGDITVWQGWVGNDWEIFIDENGEQKMLTDNVTHDIGPRINADYIIWQSFESEAWKAKIYTIKTKAIETISNTEGLSVENPRFVLVYDAKSENGDVETRGYDPVSGTNVPLSAVPVSVPSEIPDPDQTGEERALIAAGSQLKTKVEEEAEPDALPPDVLGDGNDSGTSTEDILVPPFEDAITDITPDTSTSSVEHIVDVVIISPATTTPLLPDLVIPPFDSVGSEEVLPQQMVATSS